MPVPRGDHGPHRFVGFDAKRDKLVPLKHPDWPKDNDKSKNKSMPNKQKLSEMCPV